MKRLEILMKRLPTVSEAKTEIRSLQSFVQLVEEYQTKTLEQKILKTYAYTGSIKEVVSQLNQVLEDVNLPLIDAALVTDLLKSKPKDQLHRILRTNYLNKTRHMRKTEKLYKN